jgi:putative transcriptional regulator
LVSIGYNTLKMADKVFNSLQAMRLKKQLTQEELAKIVGVTRQTIIAIEKGSYAPSVLLALKIARFFRKPLESIFKLEQ